MPERLFGGQAVQSVAQMQHEIQRACRINSMSAGDRAGTSALPNGLSRLLGT